MLAMGMRETEKSLRLYFVLSGALSALLALRDFSTATQLGSLGGALPPSWMLAIWFPIIARLALGCSYIWAGMRLSAELPRGASWIKNMLLLSICVLVIDAALIGYVLGSELGQAGVTTSIVGLLITAYLLANVRRLSDEAVAKNPPAARVA